MKDDAHSTVRALGWYSIVVAGLWSIVFAYAMHAAMPFNPIKLPFENRVSVRMLLPEGFGFFTRSPREDRLLLFRRSDRGWQSASVGPSQKAAHAFGVVRAVRAQSIEAGLLMEGLGNPTRWKRCSEDPLACMARSASSADISNRSPDPTLCGTVGLAIQETMPWAWAARGAKVTMPSRIMVATVRCEGGGR